MEIKETKIKALIRLLKKGKISVDDIKDEDYKKEVESRIIRE
jgi:ArsR family metal-binding transcriptional regulator